MNNAKPSKFHYIIYLGVVFFNSFVDLGHKVLIQDIFYQTSTPKVYTIMSALVNMLILLPYLFMFTPSGFVADRFAKVTVLRLTALAAVPLTILITFFYYLGFFWLAFAMTLLLAVQSTLNSPAKYGYIKELFGKEKLAEMNGYVQTITIIAILAGTFLFSALFQNYLAPHLVNTTEPITKSAILKIIAPLGYVLIISSCLELLLTLFLRYNKPADPVATFSFHEYVRFNYISANVKSIYANQTIFTCILALSVFWGINQVILANYGAYLKQYIQDASVLFAQGSLAVGGLGVLFGAIYAGRASRNFIETGMIPLSAIGITLGLYFMPDLVSKTAIVLIFFSYGFFGGMLVVPLNALIQFNSPDKKLGRILAGNNFTQTVFMFVFLIVTAVGACVNINPIASFHFLFVIALIGAIYSLVKLPQSLLRYITYALVSKFYHIDTYGLKNIPSSGGVLLLGNHTSYIDWAILQITCPRPIRFVMERSIYNKWYFKWLLKLYRAIPISSEGSRHSLQRIQECLRNGDIVVLFPEGFISRNGQLGKIHRGYESIVQDTDAVIVPFFIRGLWGSIASLSSTHYKKSSKHLTRHLTICYGSALPQNVEPYELKQAITKLCLQSWSYYVDELPSIPEALLNRMKEQKGSVVAMESTGQQYTGHKVITALIRLKKILGNIITNQEKRVAVMLPPSFAGVLANFVVLAMGKAVVNLNYTSSKDALLHAVKIAEIKTVITSKTFLEKLAGRGFDLSILSEHYNVLFLEDYRAQLQSKINLLFYLGVKFMPHFILRRVCLKKTNSNDTAIIYFTSGSEGLPKGVELTHKNILVNAKQTSSVICVQDDDSILSCLPLFHAFGLTATSIMPLIEGIDVVFHPDPTDSIGIAKAIAKYQITLLCGTSTFLNLYLRNQKVHPLMLKSLRLVISGAEKLSKTVAEQFYFKFGVSILEGYGATETSPIISVNLPDILIPDYWYIQQGYKEGSVGMPIPGTLVSIADPETFAELPVNSEGMILVAGPQVMKGYLLDTEKTEKVLIHKGGQTWYVTGDKGFIDEDGYITIVDRYSRFAKIGGEMLSLLAVENAVRPAFSAEAELMAVNLPDPKKGERIIVLVAHETKPLDEIQASLKPLQISPIMLPSKIVFVNEIPKLGSGKMDIARARKMADDLAA